MTMYAFLACKVGQYMVPQPRSLSPEVSLGELEDLFEKLDFNAFPVVENGKLTGFVTKFDFLKAFQFTTSQLVPHYDELMRKTVRDVMSTNIVSVTIEQPLTRALQLMIETRARSFPVVNAQGGLVGIISRQDIMRALRASTTPPAVPA